MGKLNFEIPEIQRKVMPLIIMIDASGNMRGKEIDMINSTLQEFLCEIEKERDYYEDFEVKVAIMQYSSGCQWLTSEGKLQSVDDCKWHNIVSCGLTDFGEALKELNSKMSRKVLFNNPTGNKKPVIILIAGQVPTDDWEDNLKALQDNNWFKHSKKIAINTNDCSNMKFLEKFTGNIESVFFATKKEILKSILKELKKKYIKDLIDPEAPALSIPEWEINSTNNDEFKDISFDVDFKGWCDF